jgi:hypothetical protein
MVKQLISPVLADLKQEFAGTIPLDILRTWIDSDGSRKTHRHILEPYRVIGTVVSSDSAGLSKLTGERTLLEVMKLVNEPKIHVYQYGKYIGGTGVCVWAADNTLMFYPKDVDADQILTQMIAAQNEIKKLTVQIGLGVHHGTFIRFGTDMFGADEELIENIAEDHTSGQEIALTEAFKKHIKEYKNHLKPRSDLRRHVYSLQYSGLNPTTQKHLDIYYPLPFDKEFFHDIIDLKTDEASQVDAIYKKYAQQRIVILIKVFHEEQTYLLDELTEYTVANALITQAESAHKVERIKSNGSLGIFVSTDITDSIRFAQTAREALAKAGFISSIGISQGEVLIFNLENGSKDIAGGPVNIASKLAEDSGEKNSIMVHDVVAVPSAIAKKSKPFKYSISHLVLTGKKI